MTAPSFNSAQIPTDRILREGETDDAAMAQVSPALDIFKELDQITPSVTNSLQAFCSLAVHQMKQYPTMMQTLQDSIGSLSTAVEAVHNRIDKLEAKEENHCIAFTDASKEADKRLDQIENALDKISRWKLEHEEAIETGRQTSEERSNDIMHRVDDLDHKLRQTERDSGVRMDAIDEAACTNAQIRDDVNQRLNNLAAKFESFSDSEIQRRSTMQTRLEEHDARLVLSEENHQKASAELLHTGGEIEKLNVRCEPLESAIGLLRADITSMERDMTRTDHDIQGLQSFRDSIEREYHSLDNRLSDLENDGRIPRLEELFPRVSEVEKTVVEHEEANKSHFETLDSTVQGLEQGAACIYPKVKGTVADLEKADKDIHELKATTERLIRDAEASQYTQRLQHEETERLEKNKQQLQTDFETLQESQTSEAKRIWSFVEEAIRSVPRSYEMERLEKSIEVMQTQLMAEIEDSKNTVKFDLLHDPSPQVDQLKEYIEQQEDGQSKLKKRVMVLEEGLRAQAVMTQRAESQLEDTERRLPAVDAAQEQIAEMPKIKQRIQQISQSIQGLQEQLLQLKKQSTECIDRSFSRCSSLRSSVMLNPAALTQFTRKGSKGLRRLNFMEQEERSTPRLMGSLPKSAENTQRFSEQEPTGTTARTTPTSPKDAETMETAKPTSPTAAGEPDPRLSEILEGLLATLQTRTESRSDNDSPVVSAEDFAYLIQSTKQNPWQQITACVALLSDLTQVSSKPVLPCQEFLSDPCVIVKDVSLCSASEQSQMHQQKLTDIEKNGTRQHSPLQSSQRQEDSPTSKQTKPSAPAAPLAERAQKDRQRTDSVAPLSLMPPANFHTQRRNIAEEQLKRLARMQGEEEDTAQPHERTL